jgi:cytochrome c peroxidase
VTARLAIALLVAVTGLVRPAAATASWRLAGTCPASFELSDGSCRLRTPYQDYRSLSGAGVGGLKSGLPAFRDGFRPAQIDLGRYLFFDPALSGNGKVACATCHRPDHGFAEGRARSVGVAGHEVRRNAPSLWNVGFLQKFFWDGRAHTLEEQVQGPLYGALEMGTSPQRLEATLNGIPAYRELFAQAFPGTRAIRAAQVYEALAAFESSLVSLNSRYDLYAHGIRDALTPREIEGLNVFRSFVARCAECHTPPLFTNQQIAVIGMPEPQGHPFDPGAGEVSGVAGLRGGFRIPSLRNVALTAPYGHAGQFGTLRETAAFYTGGRGHAVPKGEKLQLHWHIWEPHLSATELDRLVDFLQTLTDESFRPATPTAVPSGLAPAT